MCFHKMIVKVIVNENIKYIPNTAIMTIILNRIIFFIDFILYNYLILYHEYEYINVYFMHIFTFHS